MIRTTFLLKLFLPVLCSLLWRQMGFSQANQPVLPVGFSNEIGLDFAPFLRSQQGFSVFYKRKIGRIKADKWQKQSALRVIVGWYNDPIHPESFQYQRGDTTFVRSSPDSDAKHYFAGVGYERQLNRNKFRFYYGGEVLYQGNTYRPDNLTEAIVNGSTFQYDNTRTELTTHGPEVAALAGCNYFFLPRLSVGLEMKWSYGIEFITGTTFRNDKAFFMHKNSDYIADLDFFHVLFLSYRF